MGTRRISVEDWVTIRSLYEDGASVSELSSRFKCTPNAIYQRKKTDNWQLRNQPSIKEFDKEHEVPDWVNENTDVIALHKSEWNEHRKISAKILDKLENIVDEVIISDSSQEEQDNLVSQIRTIKLINETLKSATDAITARQNGERKAWKLDTVAPAKKLVVEIVEVDKEPLELPKDNYSYE